MPSSDKKMSRIDLLKNYRDFSINIDSGSDLKSSKICKQGEEFKPSDDEQELKRFRPKSKSTRAMEEEQVDSLAVVAHGRAPNSYRNVWLVLNILVVCALLCTLSFPAATRLQIWNLELWKWEALALVLISSIVVSDYSVHIFVFVMERNFLLKNKVMYFVYGLKTPAKNFLSGGLALILWHFYLVNSWRSDAEIETLLIMAERFWFCCLIGTLVWLLKTLMVKVIAHLFTKAAIDTIQESLFKLHLVERLSNRASMFGQLPEPEKVAERRKFYSRTATFPFMSKGQRMSANGRFLPEFFKTDKFTCRNEISEGSVAKRMMNIVRLRRFATLDEQIRYRTCISSSEIEAKAAAEQIFLNVVQPGSKYISFDNLIKYVPRNEASKMINYFENGASESQKISKSCLRNWVVNALGERRTLLLRLNDVNTPVHELHQIVNILAGILIVVIWLLVFEATSEKFLLFLSSQIIAAAFVFGNTCRMLFESIVFMFFMHPFDVGDRCQVDGAQVVVEKMHVMSTVFLREDDQRIIYPNSVLAGKSISKENWNRPPGDSVEFCIHVSTAVKEIAVMTQRLRSYIESKNEDWCPESTMEVKQIEEMDKLRMAFCVTHKNHKNLEERRARKENLTVEMVAIFKELKIEYQLVPIDYKIPTSSHDSVTPNCFNYRGEAYPQTFSSID